ncbi:MAG: hypothetical protein LBU32_12365 [Clostridiales bacterium]|jgi:hypothetical protein|nr:hypothetical protein [Clostridiales bacterium]
MTLYTRYGDGEISKSEYIDLRDKADCRLAALNAQLFGMESERPEKDAACDNPFRGIMAKLRFEERLTREITIALIDKMLVYGSDKIEIKRKFTDVIDGDGCAVE